MNTMKILRPGQTVTLNEARPGEASTEVIGKITNVSINANLSVIYQVAWWSDRVHYEKWFAAGELIESPDCDYIDAEFIKS